MKQSKFYTKVGYHKEQIVVFPVSFLCGLMEESTVAGLHFKMSHLFMYLFLLSYFFIRKLFS